MFSVSTPSSWGVQRPVRKQPFSRSQNALPSSLPMSVNDAVHFGASVHVPRGTHVDSAPGSHAIWHGGGGSGGGGDDRRWGMPGRDHERESVSPVPSEESAWDTDRQIREGSPKTVKRARNRLIKRKSRSTEAGKAAHKAANRRYSKTDGRKASDARYRKTDGRKASDARYDKIDKERSMQLLEALGEGAIPKNPSITNKQAAAALQEVAQRSGLKASKNGISQALKSRRTGSQAGSSTQGIAAQLKQTNLGQPKTQQEADAMIAQGRQMMASGYNFVPPSRPITPRNSWSGAQYLYTDPNGNSFHVTDHRAEDGTRSAQWYDPNSQQYQYAGESQRKPNAQHQNE